MEAERDRDRERQTGRDRQTDRQTERRFVLSCACDAHILQHETCGRQGVDWGVGGRERERD